MDEESSEGRSVYSRGQAFGEGMLGGQQEFTSPSLQEYAQQYNAKVPRAYKPSGSLNGMSAEQYKDTLGGAFAVRNGSSSSTYDTKKYFGGE